MSDLTSERLDQIEKAAARRQVVHTYVNGEPDGMTNAVLALVARVRELEAQVANVGEIVDPRENLDPDQGNCEGAWHEQLLAILDALEETP